MTWLSIFSEGSLSVTQWFALALLALSGGLTPGPNNLILLNTGVRFGLRRSLPAMLGVSLGHAFLLFCAGSGLTQLITHLPVLHTALKLVGIAYLLYLAWKIATAPPLLPQTLESTDVSQQINTLQPPTFLQMALFQWANPKGILMALMVTATYLPAQSSQITLILMTGLFCMTNGISVLTWTAFGTLMRRWLATPQRVQRFNWIMASLLALSLIPLL